MLSDDRKRLICHYFLCSAPVLVGASVAIRPLRIPGVYHAAGAAIFAMLGAAAWVLGVRHFRDVGEERRLLAIGGALLISPFLLMALFWVGLGPPWVATAAENQMRYLVLMGATISIVGGFTALQETLGAAGERVFSTLGFSAVLLAGPMQLVWATIMFAAYFAKEHSGKVPEGIRSLNEATDLLLFTGGALCYLATVAFALSLRQVKWLGRRAARVYVATGLAAFGLLVNRGIQFPDPSALSTPWYTHVGLVVGVPAVPFIMPFLLGVVLLRRAGDERK